MSAGGETAAARLATLPAAKPRPQWLGTDLVHALLIAPSILLVVVVLGIPIVLIAISSLQPNVLLNFDGPAFDNYRYLATRAYYIDVIIRTFEQAVLTTLLT